MGPRRARAADAGLIAGPALLALALCLYELSGRSLGFDESASVAIASQHGGAFWHGVAHDGGNMAGYYVLLHVLVGLFGNSPAVLRLPSALAAAAATALVTVLGLRLFDRRAALCAGVLCAVSLPMVFWGQSARSYALLVAFSTGSFLAFWALIDARRPRAAFIGYVACTALAAYMSLMATLIVPAQLAVLPWHRRRIRSIAAAVAAIAACCVPLMVLAARRGPGQLFWVPRPDGAGVKQVLEALTSAGLQPNIRSTATTVVLLALTGALVLACAAPVLAGRADWRLLLALSWLVVPVALALVESYVGQPIFLARNLLMCLPAVALLLGWGLTRARVPMVLAAGTLAAVLALRALQLAPSYGVSPEDWRGATRYVLGSARQGDCVAFYPSDGRQAFEYYLPSRTRRRAPRPVLPRAPFTEVRAYVEDYATLSVAQLRKVRRSCPRVWLISSHEGQPGGPAGSRANLRRYLALRAALGARYSVGPARFFGYAAAVRVALFTR